MKKKLLITGASGFLGWNICAVARSQWDIVGTVFTHAGAIPGCKTVTVDLTSRQACKELFMKIRPDAVIHAAAASQPNYCQEHPRKSRRINVEATLHLARLCADACIPFAFLSTDLVFDGKNAPYNEQVPVSPISVYGEQKVEAELQVQRIYPRAAVCRMPLMFGDPSPFSGSFIQSIVNNLKENKKNNLFCDEYRTPVSAISAAAGIFMALERINGVIHLGGRERISRYEFGLKLAFFLQRDTSLIRSISQSSIIMQAPRPKDVSLDSSRAYGVGYSPLLIDDELKKLELLRI